MQEPSHHRRRSDCVRQEEKSSEEDSEKGVAEICCQEDHGDKEVAPQKDHAATPGSGYTSDHTEAGDRGCGSYRLMKRLVVELSPSPYALP